MGVGSWLGWVGPQVIGEGSLNRVDLEEISGDRLLRKQLLHQPQAEGAGRPQAQWTGRGGRKDVVRPCLPPGLGRRPRAS